MLSGFYKLELCSRFTHGGAQQRFICIFLLFVPSLLMDRQLFAIYSDMRVTEPIIIIIPVIPVYHAAEI